MMQFLFLASLTPLFLAVCRGLIKNGERQDEESVGGRRRTEALRQLCQMNPSQALNVRAMVVSYQSCLSYSEIIFYLYFLYLYSILNVYLICLDIHRKLSTYLQICFCQHVATHFFNERVCQRV